MLSYMGLTGVWTGLGKGNLLRSIKISMDQEISILLEMSEYSGCYRYTCDLCSLKKKHSPSIFFHLPLDACSWLDEPFL